MSDNADGTTHFGLVKNEAGKMFKLQEKYDSLEPKFPSIMENYTKFKSKIPKKEFVYGALCILALIFDFWVSSQTFRPIARAAHQKPELFAILFNLIDALVAVLASGVLIKHTFFEDGVAFKLAHKKAKITWLPVLWSLCTIKILLFFLYTSMVISGKIDRGPQILIIALAILVYVILHFAGSGLYYLSKLLVLKIQTENNNPDKIKSKWNKDNAKLISKCLEFKLPINNVRTFYKLRSTL